MKYSINNQRGFGTLMMVLMVGIFLLTSFTSLYVYIINRSKFQARIKESYNVINVMEQAAKVMKGQYDQILAADPTCLANTPSTCDFSGWNTKINALSYPNGSGCAATPCPTNNICIENVNNPSQPYCIPATMASNKLEMKTDKPGELKESPQNRVKSFVAKLDRFFDRSEEKLQLPDYPYAISKPALIGWLLAETKAIAHEGYGEGSRNGGPYGTQDSPGSASQDQPAGGTRETSPGGSRSGNTFGAIDNCSTNPAGRGCRQQCAVGTATGNPCFKVQFCPHGEECNDEQGQPNNKMMSMTFSFVNSSM